MVFELNCSFGRLCYSVKSSNTDEEDGFKYPEMVSPKCDPVKHPKFLSGKLKPSPSEGTSSSKVPQTSSILGKAGIVGLERAVEVLDTLGSSMSNFNASTAFVSGMGSRKNKISILAFEVANTIVKGANILQSLSKGNIQFLKKEILHSDGVQRLISTDLEELLSIAAADKREEFDVFSREVIRFGNLCKDPQWHNLGLYFQKLDSDTSTHGQIKEEVERTMQELESLALNTAELYHELHALDRFEKDYRKKIEELESLHITQRGGNRMILQGELKHQRKLVRSLEKKSLWSKKLEEVMGKLVDIVTFINQEIMEAFGKNGKSHGKGKFASKINPKGMALISKDAIHKSQRLGVCGLALHYANIISHIDGIVARPGSLPPNARNNLYHALPSSVKTVLHSQLQSFQAKEEPTIAQIKDEMKKTLRWLVPVAANTNKVHKAFGWVGEWANTSNEFNKRMSAPNNPLRLQTLYHADREKTDQCIIELVTWLHCLVSHVRNRDYGFKPLFPVRSPTSNAQFLRPVTQPGLQVHNNGEINSKTLLLQPKTPQSSFPVHNNGKINGKAPLLQPESRQSSSPVHSNGNINGEAVLLQPEAHRRSGMVNNNGQSNSKVTLQLLQPETQQDSSPVNDTCKTYTLRELLQLESQQWSSPVHNYSETNIRTPVLQPESQQVPSPSSFGDFSSTAFSSPSTSSPDSEFGSIDGIENPFFLHPSDNPGINLVNHLLTGDNYTTWRHVMTMALSAKNKMGFVDGTIPNPPSTDSLHSSWLRINNMVLSWLLNSIHRDLVLSVLYADSAAILWKDLHDRFSSSNGPRIFSLERAIATLQQNTDSITKYYNTLNSYWDGLSTYDPLPACTCGAYRNFTMHYQNRQLMQFLMGLSDTYTHIRTQILLMDPLPSLEHAYSLVLQDESQCLLQSQIHSSDSSAMMASSSTLPASLSGSHSQFNDSVSSANAAIKSRSTDLCSKSKDRCSYCNILGHTRDVCYKLNGYSPHYKGGRRSQQYEKNFNDSNISSAPSSTPMEPQLAVERYQYLLRVLNEVYLPPKANLVGPLNEEGDWYEP